MRLFNLIRVGVGNEKIKEDWMPEGNSSAATER
jgi:hypothetical protein